MAKHVSHIIQTPSAAGSYIGRDGEFIVEDGAYAVRVHDGVTPGGAARLITRAEADDLYIQPDLLQSVMEDQGIDPASAADVVWNDLFEKTLPYRGPVISITNDPPAVPAVGDRYIVGTVPTGTWVGSANKVAEWTIEAQWRYATPKTNTRIFNTATLLWYKWTGAAWTASDLGASTDITHKSTSTAITTSVYIRQRERLSMSDFIVAADLGRSGFDAASAVRAAIASANADKIGTIEFPYGVDGTYKLTTRAVEGGVLPRGLQFVGIGRRSQTIATNGVTMQYTGSGIMWDIIEPNGTDETGHWWWRNMKFECTHNSGGAFKFNGSPSAFTPTDDNTTPNYIGNARFSGCYFGGANGGLSQVGDAIIANKMFKLILDDDCDVRHWRRGVWAVLDNSKLLANFTENGRHVMLEKKGSFCNNNKVDPAFFGPPTDCNEDIYHFYDGGQYTRFGMTLFEGTADACIYIDGTECVYDMPTFGASAAMFNLGPNARTCRMIAPVMGAGGINAPVIQAAAALGKDTIYGQRGTYGLKIVAADHLIKSTIGEHPRIDWDARPPMTHFRKPRMTTAGLVEGVRVIDQRGHHLHINSTDIGGFNGPSSWVADALSSSGWAAVLTNGVSANFQTMLTIGQGIYNGNSVRTVFRTRTPVSSTNWRWSYGINGSNFDNGALSVYTSAYGLTVVEKILTGFVDGDVLTIAVYDGGASQPLRVDGMVIQVIASPVAPLTNLPAGTPADALTQFGAAYDQTTANQILLDLATKINQLETACATDGIA